MSDYSGYKEEFRAALAHAAAFVLLELQKLGQGYTTLYEGHPAVIAGVAVAKDEATTRGASAEQVAAIAPAHIVAAAQEMGTAGLDPAVVAAESKALGPELTESEAVHQANGVSTGVEAAHAASLDPHPAAEPVGETKHEPVEETESEQAEKPAA